MDFLRARLYCGNPFAVRSPYPTIKDGEMVELDASLLALHESAGEILAVAEVKVGSVREFGMFEEVVDGRYWHCCCW